MVRSLRWWLCAATVGVFVVAVTAPAQGSSARHGSAATASGGGIAEANKKIAPYVGHPSAFPITQKLTRVPKDATVAFVDCGTPICALIHQLVGGAAKVMGVKLDIVKGGIQANQAAAALDTVVSQKPDAVIVTALDTQLWKNQLKELQKDKVAVVTLGNTSAQNYGIKAPQGGAPQSTHDGALMADYVAAKFGAKSNIVFYDTPELSFTGVLRDAFGKELKNVCPGCSTRTVHVPVTSLGNRAPSQVVSDLQAHPSTTVAVFGTDEVELGLPAALKTAGLSVKTLGYNPAPANLAYIKQGKETAALSADLPVSAWTLLDQAVREIIGQKLVGDESKGLGDVQFLTQKDITFNPSKGWAGYPDFAKRFATLWGVKHG